MGCGGSKASHEDVAIKVDAAQPEADGKTPATPPAATKNAVIGYKEVVATGAAAQPEAEAEREWPAFSEEQVATLGARVGEALKAAFPDNETAYNEQMVNLHRELAKRGNDRQGHGEVYATVLDYLDGLALEEGIQHGAGEADPAADYDPPDEYPGEEGLGRLWVQVRFLTTADDLPRLEAELTSRSGPEQWSSLIEVRKLLLVGDPEEAAAYARWDPTAAELDAEFEQLMGKVGKEENVSDDYAKADAEGKKRMVWDTRKFVADREAAEADEEEGADAGEAGTKTGAAAALEREPTAAPWRMLNFLARTNHLRYSYAHKETCAAATTAHEAEAAGGGKAATLEREPTAAPWRMLNFLVTTTNRRYSYAKRPEPAPAPAAAAQGGVKGGDGKAKGEGGAIFKAMAFAAGARNLRYSYAKRGGEP